MSTTTTITGSRNLKPKNWYRILHRDSRYVIYSGPTFESKKVMVLPKGQMFMVVRVMEKKSSKTALSQGTRVWVHIGTSDIFGYVNLTRGNDIEFEEVQP